MAVIWTDEQKKAIDKSGCNLIVAAAAGSGKTAVLVEKIVNIIENGEDIDRLLVTTFTDAAAKKMKQEIGDEIKNRLAQNPSDIHLSRQKLLLSRADICTIDSFCTKIVRQNFHLLDIDPDFKIADTNESELLRAQAATEVFEELYEANDEGFYNLLEGYANQRGDSALSEIVLSLHAFARTIPDYKSWLSACVNSYENFDGNIFKSKWGKVILQSSKIIIEGCIEKAGAALLHALNFDEMSSYTEPLREDIEELKSIKEALDECSFNEAVIRIRDFACASGGRAKPKTPDEIKEPVVSGRKYVSASMKKLAGEFYYDSEENIISEISSAKTQIEALCKVVIALEERFFEIKTKRGVLDFADIEHLALKVLDGKDENENIVPSEVACELRDKYKLILIDEYQDSNELQELIFSRITRGDNIFMVGDLKQSIYRFRHTNPLLFKNKKDTYNDDEGINQRVIMSKNFRSDKNVIDFVNFVMAQNASPLVGELVYDETERLNFGADDNELKPHAPTSVHIIDAYGAPDTDDSVFGAEAEAVRVAKCIKKLINDKTLIYDKKEGMRPIQYKDIVILMRSPSVDAQIFNDVLSSFDIPTFSDISGGYFMTDEIELMLCLLSIIDNPVQDIKLLAVLRSVIGGFDDTELMQMRLCERKGDIYTALCACAKGKDELAKKCEAFLLRLKQWRKKALYMRTHELIGCLYNDTGYYDLAGALNTGEQRKANLNLLIEYARNYEKTSFKGLFNFVSYAERVKSASRDVGSAKILGENQDVVRIMSIHKSKGLEFGVVFVTRLAKKFNTIDLNKDVLVHLDLGIGIDHIDTINRYRYPTFIKRAIKEKLRLELLSEELRVLYVALTRAREKLVLTIAPGSRENKKDKWLSGARGENTKALPLYYTSSANSFSDWIMGALMRHKAAMPYAVGNISPLYQDVAIELYSTPEFVTYENTKKDYTDINIVGDDIFDEINDKLSYEYAYEGAKNVPTKVSVTEMKRLINREIDKDYGSLYEEQMIMTPSFMTGKGEMSAAEKGSAVHFVMQHLDLNAPLDHQGILLQVENMLSQQIITKEYADAVDAKKISEFFESPLGERMALATNIVREMPFEISIDASDLVGKDALGEKTLLQGVIDCYFYEGDEIILIDYKTDYVKDESDIEKIKQKYALQIELYAQALEKITNKKVKEKNLYLFSCQNVIKY